MQITTYADNCHAGAGFYRVTYIVNKTNEKLTRSFDSPYLAKQFVNKLKYSKRCRLVSAPLLH